MRPPHSVGARASHCSQQAHGSLQLPPVVPLRSVNQSASLPVSMSQACDSLSGNNHFCGCLFPFYSFSNTFDSACPPSHSLLLVLHAYRLQYIVPRYLFLSLHTLIRMIPIYFVPYLLDLPMMPDMFSSERSSDSARRVPDRWRANLAKTLIASDCCHCMIYLLLALHTHHFWPGNPVTDRFGREA